MAADEVSPRAYAPILSSGTVCEGSVKHYTCICCGSILSLVQFFIFLCFILIIIHYHTQKQRKIKIEPRIKLNHNIYT